LFALATLSVSSTVSANELMVPLTPGSEYLVSAGTTVDTRVVCQPSPDTDHSHHDSICVCDWVKNNFYGWGEYALNLVVLGNGHRTDRKIMLDYFSNTTPTKK